METTAPDDGSISQQSPQYMETPEPAPAPDNGTISPQPLAPDDAVTSQRPLARDNATINEEPPAPDSVTTSQQLSEVLSKLSALDSQIRQQAAEQHFELRRVEKALSEQLSRALGADSRGVVAAPMTRASHHYSDLTASHASPTMRARRTGGASYIDQLLDHQERARASRNSRHSRHSRDSRDKCSQRETDWCGGIEHDGGAGCGCGRTAHALIVTRQRWDLDGGTGSVYGCTVLSVVGPGVRLRVRLVYGGRCGIVFCYRSFWLVCASLERLKFSRVEHMVAHVAQDPVDPHLRSGGQVARQ